MGRQINFYMSDKMRQEFVDFLTNKGFCYVDDGVCEEVTYIAPSDIYSSFKVYLYKKEFGKINLRDTGIVKYIDGCYNPVIEYIISRPSTKTVKRILNGRVWMTSDDLYDENADRELMTKEYNKIIRWLKKHLLYENIEAEKYTYCKHGGYTIKEYIDEEAIRMITEDGFTLG